MEALSGSHLACIHKSNPGEFAFLREHVDSILNVERLPTSYSTLRLHSDKLVPASNQDVRKEIVSSLDRPSLHLITDNLSHGVSARAFSPLISPSRGARLAVELGLGTAPLPSPSSPPPRPSSLASSPSSSPSVSTLVSPPLAPPHRFVRPYASKPGSFLIKAGVDPAVLDVATEVRVSNAVTTYTYITQDKQKAPNDSLSLSSDDHTSSASPVRVYGGGVRVEGDTWNVKLQASSDNNLIGFNAITRVPTLPRTAVGMELYYPFGDFAMNSFSFGFHHQFDQPSSSSVLSFIPSPISKLFHTLSQSLSFSSRSSSSQSSSSSSTTSPSSPSPVIAPSPPHTLTGVMNADGGASIAYTGSPTDRITLAAKTQLNLGSFESALDVGARFDLTGLVPSIVPRPSPSTSTSTSTSTSSSPLSTHHHLTTALSVGRSVGMQYTLSDSDWSASLSLIHRWAPTWCTYSFPPLPTMLRPDHHIAPNYSVSTSPPPSPTTSSSTSSSSSSSSSSTSSPSPLSSLSSLLAPPPWLPGARPSVPLDELPFEDGAEDISPTNSSQQSTSSTRKSTGRMKRGQEMPNENSIRSGKTPEPFVRPVWDGHWGTSIAFTLSYGNA